MLTGILSSIGGKVLGLGLLIVLIIAGYSYHSGKVASLEKDLANIQYNYNTVLQSNDSLEAELERQKEEFRQIQTERDNIRKADEESKALVNQLREQIESTKEDLAVMRIENPEGLVDHANRKFNCLLQNFENPEVCASIVPPQTEGEQQ